MNIMRKSNNGLECRKNNFKIGIIVIISTIINIMILYDSLDSIVLPLDGPKSTPMGLQISREPTSLEVLMSTSLSLSTSPSPSRTLLGFV